MSLVDPNREAVVTHLKRKGRSGLITIAHRKIKYGRAPRGIGLSLGRPH